LPLSSLDWSGHSFNLEGPLPPSTEAVLLDRLLDAHRSCRRVVFLVGAGLSLPPAPGAPGVPGAGEIVRRVMSRLPTGAIGSSAPLGYQEALELYRQHRGQQGLDHLVREAALEACSVGDPVHVAAARAGDLDACRRLERSAAVWALPPGVEALGRLIAACPETFGTAVFTTNFDPLVELAIRRAGGQCLTTFLSEDGRFSDSFGDGCHVIHVHGFWSGEGRTAHTVAQLTRLRPQLRRDLERFLERSDLMVLGYGGWKDVFSEVITTILIDPAQRTDVLWCFYEKDWDEIERRYTENLKRLEPGLDTVVVPYVGIDGNAFLPRLAAELTAVAPVLTHGSGLAGAMVFRSDLVSPFVAGPPITTDAGLFGRRSQKEQIAAALERCQPVQLLGERRMGKTSLLLWVKRHAGRAHPGWPVAWVDTGALVDRSPEGLILAIGESLGVAEEVDEHLQSGRTAWHALDLLLPLVLLVDEADALAVPGQRFDPSFLGLLRAAGQGQRLAWVSTSHSNLHTLFQQDQLTSPFLNDSLRLTVGALEEGAADTLLAQALDSNQSKAALTEAGRLPYPLQWIADAMFQEQAPEMAADALRNALEPAYDSWWRSRGDEKERRLLGECVKGIELAALDGRERDRRRLRGLVERGLVIEQDGQFTLPGTAWTDFVRERHNG
jgi:hypothetical protein